MVKKKRSDDAEMYGPMCPQRTPSKPISEDCLQLNIWRIYRDFIDADKIRRRAWASPALISTAKVKFYGEILLRMMKWCC